MANGVFSVDRGDLLKKCSEEKKMNDNHRSAAIGFLAAMLAAVLVVAVGAQDTTPSDDADDVVIRRRKSSDPAVEAILATNPRTPADWARAADILADLDEPELAKGFLKKILDANLDQEQLADLADRHGSALFTRISSRSELLPEGRTLADAVLGAQELRLRSPERIAGLIAKLQDPVPDVRYRAMAALRESGEAAFGPLVAVLADPARQAEHSGVVRALARLGSDAARPLVGCLDAPDSSLVVGAISALAEANVRDATIWLLAPLLAPESDPAVRSAAASALGKLVGPLPSRDEASAILADRAAAYFDGKRDVQTDTDNQVALWHWDTSAGRCVVNRYPADVARTVLAARLAQQAARIVPEDAEIKQLRLLATLEAAAYENGLDTPLDMAEGTSAAEAAALGVDAVAAALEQAMTTGHMPAAAALATILGRIGTTETVLAASAEPAALARAVRSADRRLRFAALGAIMNLQPARAFAGSSYVSDALTFFARSSGRRRAMVAGPHTEDARRIGGLLGALGFEVDTAATGRDMLAQLIASPDYELVLIDAAIQRPPVHLLVPQLRHDARTAALPVGVLGTADDVERSQRAARPDPLAEAMIRPHDQQAVAWQVERLTTLAGRAAVPAEVRLTQARQTLAWLAALGGEPRPVFDLGDAEAAALAALYSPELGPEAVAVLETLGTPASQRALVDLGSRATQPVAMRRTAVAALLNSIQKHGVLLTSAEILAQYDLYNASEDADVETQQILGRILDAIEAPSKPVDQKQP